MIARRTLLAAGALAPLPALAAAGKPRVALKTGKGVIVLELEAQKAPLTAANFLKYVDAKEYDAGEFFRATRTPGAPEHGTIVGAPSPRIHPYPPIAHESTTQTGLRHLDGTISLGRFQPGSATDNFFICIGPQPYLDAHPGAKGDNLGFAAFGQVVRGMEVVRAIHAAPANGKSPFATQRGEWLKTPVPILTARRV
jgi:peptidyl-prolyl cis-trans isomerase A (cyclophilin A)